jgi:hypothetical protein
MGGFDQPKTLQLQHREHPTMLNVKRKVNTSTKQTFLTNILHLFYRVLATLRKWTQC